MKYKFNYNEDTVTKVGEEEDRTLFIHNEKQDSMLTNLFNKNFTLING